MVSAVALVPIILIAFRLVTAIDSVATASFTLLDGSISGQYQCICAFPAMMQSFQNCMSSTCSLDDSTIQNTLGNVQQICASCTPDGCNAFSISGSGNGGGSVTFQAPISSATAGLCYITTQSEAASTLGGLGGVVGSGFFSVGLGPCPSSSPASSESGSSASNTIILSDDAAASGTTMPVPGTSAASSFKFRMHLRGVGTFFLLLALALGGALV
ncbi:hypothetical protein GGX14DRAFT_462981 [Mycena pura]|uniref:Extracellular membrane protein CFEM domain-containing protein n=1 Tax=Mycena pura TaxID=153505 RepID=A0AAD6V4Y7_9AGAR|nr:hypothetical protein GGX14DRAFT_462981 [Mycena pura]